MAVRRHICAIALALLVLLSTPLAVSGVEGALPEADGRGDSIALGSGASTIKLDHLGPLVVAEDGTLSRIPNWSELGEREQEIAWRRIRKRNDERLARLREQGPGEL